MTFHAYVRDHVLRAWDIPKGSPALGGMTARQYRAYRRTLRRLWRGLPREMQRR